MVWHWVVSRRVWIRFWRGRRWRVPSGQRWDLRRHHCTPYNTRALTGRRCVSCRLGRSEPPLRRDSLRPEASTPSPRSLSKKMEHRALPERLCKAPGVSLQDNAGPIRRSVRSIRSALQIYQYWYLSTYVGLCSIERAEATPHLSLGSRAGGRAQEGQAAGRDRRRRASPPGIGALADVERRIEGAEGRRSLTTRIWLPVTRRRSSRHTWRHPSSSILPSRRQSWD